MLDKKTPNKPELCECCGETYHKVVSYLEKENIMYIKKELEVKEIKVVDILCDVCGSSCKDSHSYLCNPVYSLGEYMTMNKGFPFSIHLCTKCYNKTLAALRGWKRQSGYTPKNDALSQTNFVLEYNDGVQLPPELRNI